MNEQGSEAVAGREVPAADLSADNLGSAIAAQKEIIAAFELEFVPMRKRYERLRGRLRDLEGERERRRLNTAGQADTFRPVPRRSITALDALSGRERTLSMDEPLSRFTFTSVRRQLIVLHPTGDHVHQRITFYRQPGPEIAEAGTFGEARRLMEAGWTPGVPGVALSRLAVYYPETATAGWLRLDQMYFDEP